MEIKDRLNILVEKFEKGNATLFAKKTGISQSTLHRYLNGRMPNLESLIAIRDKYNINMNWIATGEGEMFSRRGNKDGITIEMPEIAETHPKIVKIINLLKTMEKTDIEDFEKILEEKKKMRDMEYKILKMEEILRQKNA